MAKRSPALLAAALACAAIPAISAATLKTALTSFEFPIDAAVTLRLAPQDSTLTATFLRGGEFGSPPAQSGGRLLRLQFTDEPDGKIEIGIGWPGFRYDLLDQDELRFDLFVAAPAALPGLVGVYSPNWSPPDAWQPALAPPGVVGAWTTVRIPLAGRTQTNLDHIWALVFEQIPGAAGTLYIDNLRLVRAGEPSPPLEVATNAFADRNEVAWNQVPLEDLVGYHVYRAAAPAGPFTRLTAAPLPALHFVDPGPFAQVHYYAVSAVTTVDESPPSAGVAAVYNGLTDEQLLDALQQATFRYFWETAHPVSGLAIEALDQGQDRCALGGTGMSLMGYTVGAARGFQPRAVIAQRVLQVLTFLEEGTPRFHGAWAHWINGATGAPIPFSTFDDAADLVETSYAAMGLLTVRQYFTGADAVETEIRTRATRLWEAIEWSWFRRYPDGMVLYWHWSPNYEWIMDLPIYGYNETQITYLCAIASPTHPLPPEAYYLGWAARSDYALNDVYYGIRQDVGWPVGGRLFFTQYTAMGFDPRFKRDAFTNYFVNSRACSLIHRAYAIDNPRGFLGYNRWGWGLTSSHGPFGYREHEPTYDNGTIAPTAAMSAMPFTPHESVETLRYFRDRYAGRLGSVYGFRDAFNPTLDWFSDTFIAIDQGPILVNVENYRTGLCWRLFMSNPEVRAMVDAVGFVYEPDLDHDEQFTGRDGAGLVALLGGPQLPAASSDPEAGFACDIDRDHDVDLADVMAMQRIVGSE